MAGDCDQITLIRALADLAGRAIPGVEAAFVLEHSRHLTAQRANDIWSQHRRAPSTVSMRDYLAMTLLFLDRSRWQSATDDPDLAVGIGGYRASTSPRGESPTTDGSGA